MKLRRWKWAAAAVVAVSGLVLWVGRPPSPQSPDDVGTNSWRTAAANPNSGNAESVSATLVLDCASPTTPDDLWIEVRKSRRRMSLCRGPQALETHQIDLGWNPVGDKVRSGDKATPEGEYYVCRFVDPSQYYRALLISYPNKKDAARGLEAGLISPEEMRSIGKAIDSGTCPPQNTTLGGLIEIHGHRAESDWTWGCIATGNDVMDGLFERVKLGTRVRVLP